MFPLLNRLPMTQHLILLEVGKTMYNKTTKDTSLSTSHSVTVTVENGTCITCSVM